MDTFDRLNKLMGFSPTSLDQEEGEVTPSDIENIMLKGNQNLPVLEETVATPERPPATQDGPSPIIKKLPKGHPSRFDTIDGMLFYNPDTSLKGDVSKPPIPEPSTMPTIEITEPMTITGSKKLGGSEEKSSIPPAQPSYGMYAPPVKTAIPKGNKLKARKNAQVWIKDNLDYLPDNASLGLILKEMPKEHRNAIKKTVDKAIKEGMSKQTIANWLLGRKKK